MLDDSGVDYEVWCHTLEAESKFGDAGRVDCSKLHVSNVSKGLANNRNAYLETLTEGEWCLMLVDDFMYATELDTYDTQPSPIIIDRVNTTKWNRKFRTKITMKKLIQRAEELCQRCDEYGISLGGFAGNDNSMFRRTRWRNDILADGRAIVVKKSHLRFDKNTQMVDDISFTALNIKAGGGTLVNQWVLPYCKRYTAGSYGSRTERMTQRMAECFYLKTKYPGLVIYAKKPGWPYGSHVRIMNAKNNPLQKNKCLI